MAVDSICDPRFSSSFNHARQLWLEALKVHAHVLKTDIPPLRVQSLESGLSFIQAQRAKSALDIYVDCISSLYLRGVAYLASPDPETVARAYACFPQIAVEHQRADFQAVRLPGETDLEKLKRHASTTVQEQK